MKAIVYAQYGPPEVLQLKDIEKPTPCKNEVLIKIHATTVTAAEGMMRRGDTFIGRIILGLRKPRNKYRVLGLELSGEIEKVGNDVSRFKVGDQVYGFTGFKPGAYAEYKCMPEKGSLVIKPLNASYVEAVSFVDGASTALFFLREKAHIQSGQKVLIIGASGSIGSYAVQLAKYFSADVSGVCSTANMALVKSLGAQKVIDYTKEDFTKNGEKYDIIFDTVGRSSFSNSKSSLEKNGIYLATAGSMLSNYLLTLWTSIASRKKFVFAMSVNKNEALTFLKKLIEAGSIKPVIDRIYPLDKIVEAHKYVEKGHKKGNVVITVVE